jgi:hypothetical protein
MPTFNVINPVRYKGIRRPAGSSFEADTADVEDLVEAGHLVPKRGRPSKADPAPSDGPSNPSGEEAPTSPSGKPGDPSQAQEGEER